MPLPKVIVFSDHKRNAWKKAQKELGMHHRVSYQTRHSYATMYLMKGANPMWVADQLGHSNMNTLLKHYAKWIDNSQYSNVDLVAPK